jgi:hypothetical protein
MIYQPTWQTTVFIALFFFLYVVVLLKKTLKDSIDFYDLLLLSSVAIIPTAFVVFPQMMVKLAQIVGVAFPFLLLFGGLFLIVFIYLHRLVVKMNHQEHRIIVLLQELSLLRESLRKSLSEKDRP